MRDCTQAIKLPTLSSTHALRWPSYWNSVISEQYLQCYEVQPRREHKPSRRTSSSQPWRTHWGKKGRESPVLLCGWPEPSPCVLQSSKWTEEIPTEAPTAWSKATTTGNRVAAGGWGERAWANGQWAWGQAGETLRMMVTKHVSGYTY